MEINQYIDHTLLKNTASEEDFYQIYEEAKEHSFFSVCIPPSQVLAAHKILQKTQVKICSVAGFPLGYASLKNKMQEIQELYYLGCEEVDVVLNILNVKQAKWNLVEEEIKAFSVISETKCLKVIIESGILSQDEIIKICEISNKFPVSFLKTSTGFAEKGADLDDVKLIRQHAKPSIKIKASGGVKNQKQALDFIQAGADRLGCSASIAIVKG